MTLGNKILSAEESIILIWLGSSSETKDYVTGYSTITKLNDAEDFNCQKVIKINIIIRYPLCLSENPTQRNQCWRFCEHYKNELEIKQNFKAAVLNWVSLN